MLQFDIPDSLIPYNVNFQIPKAVESIFELDSTNNLSERKLFKLEDLDLTFNQSQFYCQFYIDINSSDSVRNVVYNLNLDKNLENFFVLIQQPLGAKEFQTFLVDPEIFNDEYNLTYHRKEFFNYKANDNFKIQFQYEKKNDLTSIEILEKILMDHSHGNDGIHDFQHEHEIANNDDIHNKFYKSKYISFLFGIPLLIVVIMIYFNSNKTSPKINLINNENIKFCSNCAEKYLVENIQKFCKNCGSGLNVS